MSPLFFLAIPVVVFVVGASVLVLRDRSLRNTDPLMNAPSDLRAVAPMLRTQREYGFNAGHPRTDVRR